MEQGRTGEHARGMVELLLAPARAYAVYAFVKLELADRLHEGTRSHSELAEQTGTHPEALRRLLRMLTSLDVVTGDDVNGFALGPRGDLLRRDHPKSMSDLAILYGEQAYPSFGQILHSIRTGEQSFPQVFGTTWVDYYVEHPEAGHVFDRAMNAGNAFFSAVPDAFAFAEAKSVVDVGGGNGALLEVILKANPGLSGVLAETPRIGDSARERLSATGVADRCEVVATDFFESVPANHDVYLLSRILHDWDDEDCRTVLRNVRAAVDPGATLLIIERVIPVDGRPSLAFDWDIHMLMNTGGQERTLGEFQSLLDQTGFSYSHSATLPLDVTLLVATAE
ncbi:methyltransferase [Saccharopolyspora taberi]|uniref:Methyltransferase n=2 Tax=Saccharopolyspora taberi TaxID=60895 RepID=A0ABN3VG40_9PSEU